VGFGAAGSRPPLTHKAGVPNPTAPQPNSPPPTNARAGTNPNLAARQEDKLAGVALLVLANKQDLLNAMPAHEIAEELGLSMIRDRPWQIQGCSAREGFGIEEGMGWLVKQAR
jgi:signal recognition particle receptor subunit beta